MAALRKSIQVHYVMTTGNYSLHSLSTIKKILTFASVKATTN